VPRRLCDQRDPNQINFNVLGGSDADRQALELAMTSQERREYLALMARVEARRKGEPIEVQARPIEPGEPTGEELPLDG